MNAPDLGGNVPEDEFGIPAGYRLTFAATLRLETLANAVNRHERRILMAEYDRHPIVTFERISQPPSARGDAMYPDSVRVL